MMKIKKQKSTIALFVAAAFIFIAGTALLVNNVLLYNNNITQYVEQGYSIDTVVAYYLPAQLIPGVLEPIGTIYGISILLVAAAIINQKVSECLIFSKCGNTEEDKTGETTAKDAETEEIPVSDADTGAEAEAGTEAEAGVETPGEEEAKEETEKEEKIV